MSFQQRSYISFCFLWCYLPNECWATDEAQLRQLIQTMVANENAAKDLKIQQLEDRIRQLETILRSQETMKNDIALEMTERDNANEAGVTKVQPMQNETLAALSNQVEELKHKAEQEGLALSGFFDFNARTENKAEQTFNLGAVELDLEYSYNEHFAMSSAMVWDGDSAEIGVAVIDFHWFDDSIPPRGRIFDDPGFHIQLGRFDLPFASDYQYFAAPDRVSSSAPLTTERIQRGGFNGDGARIYGNWSGLNYALYWTNSVYEDAGMSLGGRVGLSLGNNRYRLHKQDSRSVMEIGLSHLSDLDGNEKLRNAVYAADITINFYALSLLSEVVWLNVQEPTIDGHGNNYGHNHEFSYHISLLADLHQWLNLPLDAYGRYETWHPDAGIVISAEDDTVIYPVENIHRLTVGLNFVINDYFRVKFEYSDSLGTDSAEPDYENRLGTA